MLNAINVRSVSTGNITATGQYVLTDVGFPNVIDYATVVIRVGGSNITAGVGAWILLADDGTWVTLTTPAFSAINALTANSNNVFVWPGVAPVVGLGFAITTTITGGPITRITLTATVR